MDEMEYMRHREVCERSPIFALKQLRLRLDSEFLYSTWLLLAALPQESMRNTNESTNARVLWFSVFSVCVLFSTATWQVLHLKQYFKKKKLI